MSPPRGSGGSDAGDDRVAVARLDGLRTVANIRPSVTAAIAGGIASTPPMRIFPARPRCSITSHAASAMSSLWKKAASICGYFRGGPPRLPDLGDVPVGGGGVEDFDAGILLDDLVETRGPALGAGVAGGALGHDDLPLSAEARDQRLRDGGAHELVVGGEEGVDLDLVQRRDQRVHVDDGDAGVDHLLHRLDQRVDGEGLDGDEVPLLRRHLVEGVAAAWRGRAGRRTR